MGILSHVGTLAAVCTTGAFIPQIIKIKKQGGDDLSYAMLFFYLTGVLLWLIYGLMLHAPAIIWANGRPLSWCCSSRAQGDASREEDFVRSLRPESPTRYLFSRAPVYTRRRFLPECGCSPYGTCVEEKCREWLFRESLGLCWWSSP